MHLSGFLWPKLQCTAIYNVKTGVKWPSDDERKEKKKILPVRMTKYEVSSDDKINLVLQFFKD